MLKKLLKLPFRLLGVIAYILWVLYTPINIPPYTGFIFGIFCGVLICIFNIDIIYNGLERFVDWYYD